MIADQEQEISDPCAKRIQQDIIHVKTSCPGAELRHFDRQGKLAACEKRYE